MKARTEIKARAATASREFVNRYRQQNGQREAGFEVPQSAYQELQKIIERQILLANSRHQQRRAN